MTTNRKAWKLKGLRNKNVKRVRGKTSAFLYNVYTNELRVDVGIAHDTWYGTEQEIGSKKMPKLGLLTSSVYDNIADIVKIESQYLSALEDEARALALIRDEESIGGADE